MPKNSLKYLLIFFLIITSKILAQVNEAPIIMATGNQAFCPGNEIPVVESFLITDTDNIDIDAFFIQISEGYQLNSDVLFYNGALNFFDISWNASEGKLTIRGVGGGKIALSDLNDVVKNIVFSTSSTNPVTKKSFSLTIGNVNYLPLTDHFYEFVSNPGITWSNAKIAAANRTYFGRAGYLATLTSQEEANFAGKQASGAGWIGGSDEETEGVWKWVTGPETGTVFWNGAVNGTSPNFAFWNTNEPNSFQNRNEDYVHITAVGVGIAGSWNDITNTGDNSGDYQTKGYVVEYGANNDPKLSISASTRIFIPTILSVTQDEICEGSTAQLAATASIGDVVWFTAASSNIPIFTGNNYNPNVSQTTAFYVAASVNGCLTSPRKLINVVVNETPTITSFTDASICEAGQVTVSAKSSKGMVNWYETATSSTILFTGNNYTTIISSDSTFYAEATINGCNSVSRTLVSATINSAIPEFDLVEDTYFLCIDAGSVALETEKANGNFSYRWTKDNLPFSGINSYNTATEAGMYTVTAISIAGCESETKTITVRTSEKAKITKEDFLILEDVNTNSIEIIESNLGIGTYEFAIDDAFGIYQTNKKFENIAAGRHTLFIKDINDCGITAFEFSILNYPKFFTPNNDGINDVWNIKGFDSNQYLASDVYIYNRFGKLIYRIAQNQKGWDGTFNGKLLNSNEYWFYAILKDKNGLLTEKKGNFSLIK